MSQKIVINGCYGNFDFSNKGKEFLKARGYEWPVVADSYKKCEAIEYEIRIIPDLINAVEHEMGEELEGQYSVFKVVEIPDRVTDWTITSYDGLEEIICVLDGKLHFVR